MGSPRARPELKMPGGSSSPGLSPTGGKEGGASPCRC